MASIVALSGPLDNLVADLKIFPQNILNVHVRAKPAMDSLPEVVAGAARCGKSAGSQGRVVLRYSGTEPLARVMVEAEREEDVKRYSELIANALRTAIGV